MLGIFVLVNVALAMWPLLFLSLIAALFVMALMTHVPRIYKLYELADHSRVRWLGLLTLATTAGVAVATYMVFQAPFADWPKTLEPKPVALAGLIIAAWSTFVFVVVCERTLRTPKGPGDVLLEDVLQQRWA